MTLTSFISVYIDLPPTESKFPSLAMVVENYPWSIRPAHFFTSNEMPPSKILSCFLTPKVVVGRGKTIQFYDQTEYRRAIKMMPGIILIPP